MIEAGRTFSRIGTIGSAVVIAALALLMLALPGLAGAANPQIMNNSQWLESRAVGGGPGFPADPPTGVTPHPREVTVSLMVRNDTGRKITGLKIDDDYNGTDNTAAATLRPLTGSQTQQPVMVGGYDYTRVTYSWDVPKGDDLDCPGILDPNEQWQTRPIRIRAVDDNNQESSTTSANITFVQYRCPSHPTAPVIYQRSQNKSEIVPGETVSFTLTGDDANDWWASNQDFGGIRYRLRRLSDGTTTGTTDVCFGNSDNVQRSFSVTFPNRGRWVVEALLLNNSNCNHLELSGTWWRIGSVDVNSPQAASPTISLNATRPHLNDNTTVTATVADPADSSQGGAAQDIEWDDDNDGTWDGTSLGDWLTGLTGPQKQRTIDTTGMTPGLHTVAARVGDNGALGGADSIRRTKTATTQFLVDTPPVADSDLKQTVVGEPVALTLSATDADGDPLTYTIDSGPSHGTLTGSGANRTYHPDPTFGGTDSFVFKVDDGYGGTDTATVTIEVYPDLKSFSGPSGTKDSRAGTIQFDSTAAGATFECRLDGGNWDPCSSPHAVSDLPDGSHTMRVRAIAGGLTNNTDIGEATWTVDAFPKVQIDSGPPPVTGSSSATVQFTATEAGTTTPPSTDCKLDTDGWTPCISPVTYSGLTPGSHTIQVRATDAFGKQATEQVDWLIGTGPVANPQSVNTVTEVPVDVTLSASGDEPLTYTIDSGPSHGTLTGSGTDRTYTPDDQYAGTDTFEFRVEDGLDLTDTATVTVKVYPDLKSFNGPSGTKDSRAGTIQFDSTAAGATFECSLDGGSWVPCSSPLQLTDLPDGSHTMRVRAIAGGLTNSTDIGEATWTVDAFPKVQIDSAPPETTPSDSATVEFTTSEDGATAVPTTDCRIDGGTWAACTSPVTYSGLASGEHTVHIRATDAFGKQATEQVVWRVNSPPVANPDTKETVTGTAVSMVLSATDPDGNPLTYSIDTPPAHGTLTGSGENRTYKPDDHFAGTDSFVFEASDGFGGSDTATVTLKVYPDLKNFGGPSGTRDSRSGTVQFDSNATGATFECRLDGGAWEICTSPYRLGDLPDGSHTVRVRVTAGGLTNLTDIGAATWTVDASPKVRITNAPDAVTDETSATVEFTAGEDGASAPPSTDCRLDNSVWAPCSSPVAWNNLKPGKHTVWVRATDAFGKQTVASTTWTIPDKTDPPDGNTGIFDGKNLFVRLKCGPQYKPSCKMTVGPVTKKGKKAKPMAKPLRKRIKAGKWIKASFLIKPKYRKKVMAMSRKKSKQLYVRQKVKSKKIGKRKFKGKKPVTVYHRYIVRRAE